MGRPTRSEPTARARKRLPPPSLADQINAEHEAAVSKAREALEHARRAGELLLKAKEKVDHGEWLAWVRENCRFSVRTAQVYMRIAENWPRLANAQASAHLSLEDALKLLAEPRAEPADDLIQKAKKAVAEQIADAEQRRTRATSSRATTETVEATHVIETGTGRKVVTMTTPDNVSADPVESPAVRQAKERIFEAMRPLTEPEKDEVSVWFFSVISSAPVPPTQPDVRVQ